MDKFPFICILLLSICVLLVIITTIRSVEATDTIYIRVDGKIEGTNMIHRNENVYTFTGNINDSIVVERDNIVVDGSGYGLLGTGIGTGINLTGRTNVIIKNIEISGFFYGIYLKFSLNNTLSSNHIRNNFHGIYLSGSANNIITGNNITNNDSSGIWFRYSSNNNINENRIIENSQDGIWLSSSSDNNNIFGNMIRNNGYGIRLDDYSNNMLRNNKINDNECNFGVFGSLLPEFIQDIDDSNTVNGKPIYYWVNQHDKIVPSDAGYVALVNCSGITIKNLNLNNNGQGLLLAYTTNSSIIQNNITNNIHGIYLSGSSNNTITGNNIIENSANGIYLYYSPNNIFFYNNLIINTNQVYTVGAPINVWDNDFEGNYWSDYENRYPNATQLDNSGIWDTPYIIDWNNRDNYPLIPEFPSWIILPLFVIATLVVLIYRKRITKERIVH